MAEDKNKANDAEQTSSTEQTSNSGSLVDRIIQNGKMARENVLIPRAKEILTEFVKQVIVAQNKKDENGKPVGISHDTYSFIVDVIASIDRSISSQLDEVLHNPTFQRFEGSWRGLSNLVMNTETSEKLKLRLLIVNKDELFKDLDKAVEFDQSQLFKKVYEEQYGTYGGVPFSCLLGDFEFGRLPQDIELATLISNVAAAAHTPFISAASPHLFNFDSFSELSGPRDLAKVFDGTDAIKWRSFRETEDSRYFVLTLPHVLMRLPYGRDSLPVDGFNYEETVDGIDNSKFCWGNAAYALGQCITNASALYGWTAAIRGVEGGGLVSNLPAYNFKTTDGDIAVKCPTEVAITDRREKELSDLGFMSLCYCKDTDYAAFFSGQTVQKAKVYNDANANANALISLRLPYILNASRFAHYLKAMMRDKIGAFMSRQEVSIYLNTWISQYVLLTDIAPESVKASFPLREARVDVAEIPGKPGSYTAVVFLRPFFQLEELTVSLRLVARLPRPGAH